MKKSAPRKKYDPVDLLTTSFIFVMTCVVVAVLSVAQRENFDLSHESLILFIVGFYGSIVCIVIRFVILYHRVLQMRNPLRKTGVLIYFMIWTLLSVMALAMVMQSTGFSLKHNVLSGYNAYQIFMLVILLAQWLGEKFL
ncbi:MAG: hypothetical protein NC079_11270 [Clostridium sp.]|nr:hypothetical protein [Acetatifactor muris]MCM1528111.1 hypothetical protein [Bacteroides sp.]MCM1564170.1 hypothetical protein [Clostridium sp.]